jgi:hypothetical protein
MLLAASFQHGATNKIVWKYKMNECIDGDLPRDPPGPRDPRTQLLKGIRACFSNMPSRWYTQLLSGEIWCCDFFLRLNSISCTRSRKGYRSTMRCESSSNIVLKLGTRIFHLMLNFDLSKAWGVVMGCGPARQSHHAAGTFSCCLIIHLDCAASIGPQSFETVWPCNFWTSEDRRERPEMTTPKRAACQDETAHQN